MSKNQNQKKNLSTNNPDGKLPPEDGWSRRLRGDMVRLKAPWVVREAGRQFIVYDAENNVIAACYSENMARGIAGFPHMICAITGADRLLSPETDYETVNLSKASLAGSYVKSHFGF